MRRLMSMVVAALIALTIPLSHSSANLLIDTETNQFRAAQSRHRLRHPERGLWRLARIRARQTSREGQWHHPGNWGWLFSHLPGCVTGLGENLAYKTQGYYIPGFPVDAWEGSPEHRANMLGQWRFTASAVYRARGYVFYVQLFASGCPHRASLRFLP